MAVTICNYKRRGTRGVLKLAGVVDIFEAASLRETALRALEDKKADTVCVQVAKTERLDTSAVQALLVLKRDVEASGRTFTLDGATETLTAAFRRNGISL